MSASPARRGNAQRLTAALADPQAPKSLSARARSRRWEEFQRRFPGFSDMRVLDLGGTVAFWATAPVRPCALVILNLFQQDPPDGLDARVVVGDACSPPPEIAGDRFDLVFSNSVIGHLGGHRARREFAEQVQTLGARHWIQTPYRYFPIDPCFVFPGRPFLSVRLQAEVARRWRIGHRTAQSHREAVELALSVELLSMTELRHYFPHSDIWHERLGGLTKSLIATH
jgi:hypothetical protein